MPRLKKVNLFPGYARVKEPNFEVIARCTELSKGNRTVREFATLCEVSPSTISRILNQQITAPIADGLLVKICELAPKDSGVTRDVMLVANGLHPVRIEESATKEEVEKVVNKINGTVNRDGPLAERICREILQDYLLLNGYSLKVKKDSGIYNLQGFKYSADFVFETDVYESIGVSDWCFDVVLGIQHGFNRRLDMIFSACYLHQVSDQGKKVSLVFVDKMAYEQYKHQVERLYIDDYVSLILINPADRRVEEEYNIATSRKCIEIFKED